VKRLNISRFFILTSGKGGSGRTPIALVLSSLLFRHGRNVVLLDLNFSNPDAFFISTKIVSPEDYYVGRTPIKKSTILTEAGGEKAKWPLQVCDVLKTEKNFFKSVARVSKYLYAPIDALEMFRALYVIANTYENIDVIVDTNLNIPSLIPQKEDDYQKIKDLLAPFSDYKIIYIWNTGSLARKTRIGKSVLSEFDLLEKTISEYKLRGVNIFGNWGERIVHILTPNLYEKPSKPVLRRVMEMLSSLIAIRIPMGVELVSQTGDEESYMRKIIEGIKIMHLWGEGTLDIRTLRIIFEQYSQEIEEEVKRSPDFGIDIRSASIVYYLFKVFLKKMNQIWRKAHPHTLLPENLIIIPYMIEKMINYVEALLSADIITLKTILDRAKEVSNIISIWLIQHEQYG